MTDDELKTLIDRLANTLQATLLLAARLEADLKQSARDAADLLTSASQASRVLGQFRRPPATADTSSPGHRARAPPQVRETRHLASTAWRVRSTRQSQRTSGVASRGRPRSLDASL